MREGRSAAVRGRGRGFPERDDRWEVVPVRCVQGRAAQTGSRCVSQGFAELAGDVAVMIVVP